MKTICFNCGKEFDWEQEKDWRTCNDCNGTGTDGVGRKCILCNGVGGIDINTDDVPICEDCYNEEEDLEV